ncbi:MAG: AzlD domain-containing protein [Lachnospiraceae bacterium]|jgi:hypothetical protein
MDTKTFIIYLVVMAGVTYLIRAVPFVMVNKKIENMYIKAFFNYIPYTVLAAMTVPAVFYSTGNTVTAVLGFITALVLAYMRKSLIVVALSASAAVFAGSLIMGVL